MPQDIFSDAISRLDKAFAFSGIEEEIMDKLKHPEQILEVAVPIRKDDGKLEIFRGYRVRHHDSMGPTKGGLRFHPDVTREEVMALAFWMTLKCALLKLPYGGGKGGIAVDPKKLSKLELERLSRSYIQAVADFIGPDVDVPAPDVYTNSMIMGWMMDEYSIIKRHRVPSVITGKPLPLGGSQGRDDATGRGAYYCIKELERIEGWDPKTKTVAIQGFGNAGQSVANLLYQDGYKIIAISDSKNGIYLDEGFNVPSIIHAKTETKQVKAVYCEGSVCEIISEANQISNEELLTMEVDILIPSALENQIRVDNAPLVKAKVIVEVANGPTVAAADQILLDKEIMVIPDILANAGGVVVSYYEWVQNKMGAYWEISQVQQKLKQAMEDAFSNVYKTSKEFACDLRTAAYVCSLREIAEAVKATGTHRYFTE